MVPAYWVHIGLADLPDLPSGNDKDGDHWIGARSPIVQVTEFSDYQCPYCRKAYNNVRSWTSKYPDDVRLIHRQLPLDKSCNPDVKLDVHKRACEFAKAAECAAEQDLFWQMSDALFSVQDTVKITDVDVEVLAVRIGADRSVFAQCMESDRVMARIRKDMREASKRKIKGTPTFFVNSQPYKGGFPESVLKSAVEAAKAQSSKK
jgi:protein-disulfide isomerase